MPNSRSQHKTEYISLRLEPKLRRRVERECDEFQLGLAPMLRYIINDYFKRVDREQEGN